MSGAPVDETWFRRFRPADAAGVQLVCFPHAGGAAGYYLPVAAALAPAVDVLAVQYPGRQDRHAEAPVDDIGALADRIYQVLPRSADRPIAFFGHSMGALVAFEVALRCQENSVPLKRLFVSGHRDPSLHRHETVHLRDDPGIIDEIRSLGGTDTRVLDDPELRAMVIPALRADYRAVETYQCAADRQVRGPVTALVGDNDRRASVEETRAWRGHVTGDFELVVFPGGHFYLTDQAAEVIALISDRLATSASPRPVG